MRISLLTPLYQPGTSAKSGIAKNYRYLADALTGLGHEVDVTYIPDYYVESPPAGRSSHNGVRVGVFPVQAPGVFKSRPQLAKLAHTVKGIAQARRALLSSSRPPDVIETVSFDSLGLGLTGTALASRLITRVCTTTDQLAAGFQTFKSRALDLVCSLERRSILSAKNRVTHSRRHAENLAECLNVPANSFTLVPLGIPDRAPLPPPPESAWPGPTVLFAGQFTTRKAIDVVLEAGLLLLNRRADVRLVVAGGNPDSKKISDHLASMAALYGPRFLHVVQPDDDLLHAWMGTATVFTAPSRYESFGLVYPEAMRLGLPIVATSAGGIPDVIEHDVTGLLVPPGEAVPLAEAWLQCLANEDLRHRLGKAGRARFLTDFTADIMARRSVALYEEVIRSTGGSLV
ncbi:MAG: glycosyltransferase family 4 protein [Rariglobus sp.]